MAQQQDYYSLLGITRGASADEVRSAYRKLARQFHPDVNPGNAAAEEKFKAVSSAYEVLSNQEKRRLYDEFGDQGLREGFDVSKARAYQRWSQNGGAGGAPPGMGGAPFDNDVVDVDLGDIFAQFFGNRRGGRPSARRRGRDVVAKVEIDFGQALRGTEVQLHVPSQLPCPACQGSASPAKPCATCGATGRSTDFETLTVRIPPGADEGSRLRVAGRGEAGSAGGAPGDLLLDTHIRPHPYFRRDGLDIFLRLPVTLDEAYNGATVSVPTPSGTVNLRIPPRSQQAARLRLRGQGVSRARSTGDLYVDLDVRLPDTEDSRLGEALRAANSAYAEPLRQDMRL